MRWFSLKKEEIIIGNERRLDDASLSVSLEEAKMILMNGREELQK